MRLFALFLLLSSRTCFGIPDQMLKPVQHDDAVPLTLLPAHPVTATSPETGNNISITATDIARKQSFFIQDILRESPGLIIGNNGDHGRLTRLSMRGATGGENLVLIDGVPVNNPAAGGGLFDFADLMNHDIDHIQIKPGASPITYGSDTMGGVIDITTHKNHGPKSFTLTTACGSHTTHMNKATLHTEKGPFSLTATGAGFHSGRGTFTNKLHHTEQSDKYSNNFGAVKTNVTLAPEHAIEAGFRHTQARLRFDDILMTPDGVLPIAGDNTQHTRQQTSFLSYHGTFADQTIQPHIRLSHSMTARKFHMPRSLSHSIGEKTRLHNNTHINWHDQHQSDIGFDVAQDCINGTWSNKHRRAHHGIFIQQYYQPWTYTHITAGTRRDHDQKTSSAQTYYISAQQQLGHTILKSSYGTGFKAPLLADLFSQSNFTTPNPNLKPETNRNFDIGMDQTLWHDKIQFGLTFFQNNIRHIFATERTPSFTYRRINRDTRKARGVEGHFTWKISSTLTFLSNLTYTHARDDHQKAPFIPRLVRNHEIIFCPVEDLEFSSAIHHQTAQFDSMAARRLKGFSLHHLRATYRYRCFKFFGRIENLMDKRYTQTYGYGVRGRELFMGVSVDCSSGPRCS